MDFNIKLSTRQKETLVKNLKNSEERGNRQEINRFLCILGLSDGNSVSVVANFLRVSKESVRQWINNYLVEGVQGLRNKKKIGRPSKLTKSQKKELAKWIKCCPSSMGFTGACWRTPMIQHLIYEKFGVSYSVKYLSELMKNMGFSFQKAKFVASKQDKKKRQEWLENQWPEILKEANNKGAYILFGDECSFPQWGTLSYTWAPVGEQPIIETSGKRKGYKVFGLIDYFSGRFFSKGVEGKLNGDRYIEFLKEVLKKTRKPIVLIQDGAPYHKSKAVKAFIKKNSHRISVHNLPSYSPDYNPIEMLWKKIKEKGTHLHYFPTFEDLVNKVDEMLIKFENAPREIMSLFGLYENLT